MGFVGIRLEMTLRKEDTQSGSMRLYDDAKSVLAEALGITVDWFPEVERDHEVIQHLTDLARCIEIQKKIAETDIQRAVFLRGQYLSEGMSVDDGHYASGQVP